jgi:DUF4097 and DUF4098 domain-containing protein YvlB
MSFWIPFWIAMVCMVAIGTISEIYRAKIKASASESEKILEKMAQRVGRLEERMANLETIVLEKEKAKRFSGIE